MDVLEVDPIGAMGLVDESGAILLDVREDDEWAAGHAPGAVHVRLGDLDPHTFDTTPPVVAVCRSGNRSGSAATKLAAVGVTVYNLVGGMGAWQETGQPVIRDDGTAGTVV
ncbi:MAG TPA: rhodanese-like domain-containing protein [Mycobacterium sp.]|nr:rhodanese-like domain-containing protein [Mycobacterium sp.]